MHDTAPGRLAPTRTVALIGAACRFPGHADTPEAFLCNLLDGRNHVGAVPPDRWAVDKFHNERDVAGKAHVGAGHFLSDYDFRAFDADFFQLSPREVEFLDPQQRLLLELSWEAMEHAGLDVEALAGSQTGVFIGGFTVDHLLNQFGAAARDAIGTHSAAGATLTMLSNRISYAFDFRGPSLSIDTACSSSLVAFAQAVASIQSGECGIALAGGASFILRPEYMIAMSKGRFLARDGRSRSFDARGEGYGRGEGAGVVVLKDYDTAVRDGDDIIAVVEGAGVNQDGRTSGITVPNPQAQRALMERVLECSGRSAGDIDYIEAHGTGTPVGDPRETRAIADVYGRDGRCIVGSVKANIGHLEAAAGVASIIKSMMMLRNNVIPPVAGLGEVNPEIPREVELPRAVRRLGESGRTRRIAINSFGYGGTNAHVILASHEAAPAPAAAPAGASVHILPLSARDPAALRERAAQFAVLLESSQAGSLEDLLFTAGVRRTQLSHRLAVWGEDRAALATALRTFVADGVPGAGVEGMRPYGTDGRVAFVYTGMGPQWWAMGRELLRDNAAFRDAVREADAVFERIAGFSIVEELLRDEADSRIKSTHLAQPANLMVQIGLTAALRAEGVVPNAVVGHSVGEVASAWASGMLSLGEAVRVSRERSRLQAKTAGSGGMLALGMSADAARGAVASFEGAVSIAAINSPGSVTIAGDREALESIRLEVEARNVFARMLDVEVPYHSTLMEPLKPELRAALATLQPTTPTVSLYSTVSGGLAERGFDAEYWCDNVREPVQFAGAIETMIDDGYTLFVEIGPHPVLRRSLEEIAAARNATIRTASTLWMNKPETDALRRSVCEIHAHGGGIDWAARTRSGRQLVLPSYPWQRQTLWRESPSQVRDRLELQHAPLNGERGADLNLARVNYLSDHVVDGSPIMPAAGFLEALCEEARRLWPASSGVSLQDVAIHQALILDPERALRLEVDYDATTHRARVLSRDADTQARTLHAEATLHPMAGALPSTDRSRLEGGDVEAIAATQFYSQLQALSLQYGPAFQPIVAVHRDRVRGLVDAELVRPSSAGEPAAAYVLHPSLLDGCFQAALTLVDAADGAYLPVSVSALHVRGELPESIVCRARIIHRSAARIVCDFELNDCDGVTIAVIEGLVCRSLRGRGRDAEFPAGDYQRIWNPLPSLAPAPAPAAHLLLLADDDDALADALDANAKARGLAVTRCRWHELQRQDDAGDFDRVIGVVPTACGSGDDRTGEQAIMAMLPALQALAAHARPLPLRMVTSRAHGVFAGEAVVPAHAAIAAFMRVVRNEFATLDGATIDVDAGVDSAALLDEILADQHIDELALRTADLATRHAPRLVRSALLQEPARTASVPADGRVELFRREGGHAAVASAPQPVPADACEIRVERIALRAGGNDDMVGIVGVVTNAGRHATRFQPGQRVSGLVPHGVSNRMLVRTDECVLEPVDDGHDVSALLAPLQAQVQWVAQACGLRPGARALVVRGAFGDDLARQLAADGADVVRVAKDLGDWLREPNGRAFDLIAAPMSEWSHRAGFAMLATGGCLVDMDGDDTPFAMPAHAERLLRLRGRLAAPRADGAYRAILRRVLALGSSPERPSRHRIGSFAQLLQDDAGAQTTDWIEIDARDTRGIVADIADLPTLRRDGTYLVTGGLGGLGREVARWLARHGAGHVALAGRRGCDTPGAGDFIDELRSLGAEASAHTIDIGDAAAVQRLVRELHRPQAPLRGIYHAAGVLDDRPLAAMAETHFAAVMRPKATGALALHEATQDAGIALEQFVLFSSIASLVGNSRQANYCAANGFLEGLAAMRRTQGLPALAVNFGAIAGVGMLADDARTAQHLAQIGLTPLDVTIALRGLGRALAKDLGQITVGERAAWEKWAVYETVGGASPTFADLVAEARAAQHDDRSLVDQLHGELAALEDSAACAILTELIAEVVAVGLKTTPDRLRPEQSFDSFGVDSLMSTEIQMLLEQKLGVTYSVVELLGAATIARLASRGLAEIRSRVGAAA